MASEGDSVMWLRVEDEDIDEAKLLRVTVNENTTGERQEAQDFVPLSFAALPCPRGESGRERGLPRRAAGRAHPRGVADGWRVRKLGAFSPMALRLNTSEKSEISDIRRFCFAFWDLPSSKSHSEQEEIKRRQKQELDR